jgi:transcriptional regulator with XRE-family HTH domain
MERGLSQQQMAILLGYKTRGAYHLLETGKVKITADNLSIIAKVLGVHMEDLLI